MITEPEIHEITPESPGPEPDAVSKPGFLNLGPPRNGKIAKLSKELRELLNHMLSGAMTHASGVPYDCLAGSRANPSCFRVGLKAIQS